MGVGFGVFPEGVPFTGTSNYLRIIDSTQNWSAGYNGNECTVSITSWADNMIQLTANIDTNHRCHMVAGDTVRVEVWNPQSMALGKFKLTASAQ
jgi:hypothetical protein